mgnify:CR=1 FL=1
MALLNQANLVDDTGIIAGVTDYTKSVDIIADRKTILDIWEDIAQQEEGEFASDIDTNTLNFKKFLGSDKSLSVILVYN